MAPELNIYLRSAPASNRDGPFFTLFAQSALQLAGVVRKGHDGLAGNASCPVQSQTGLIHTQHPRTDLDERGSIANNNYSLKVSAAAPISWNGSPACLITCRDTE